MYRFRPMPRLTFAVILSILAWPAAAAHLELQAGRSYMDDHASNTVFAEAVFAGHPLGDSRWTWAPDASLGWIDGRDLPRYQYSRYTTSDDIWLLAGGIRLQQAERDTWARRWFVSFQPALQQGRTQALSSAYEFISTLGWRGDRFSVALRHVSNGGMHGPNRGETMLLVGVGFGP